jgi:hypothetical protein
MGSRTLLASREDVALELGRTTGVADVRGLDRAIATATDVITMRSGYPDFAPSVGTKYLAWPATDDSSDWRPWRLYLGRDIFASVTSVAVGPSSTAVPAGAGGWTAYPRNRRDDEPIRWLELDRSGSRAWSDGSTRPQDQVAVTGVPGWSDLQRDVGTLDGGINSSTTTIEITSAGRMVGVGVGNQIKIDSERMVVVDREAVDTTENLGADLDAYESNTILSSLAVASGPAYVVGEVLLIGDEELLIERIRGNTLYVRRGWNGSTLANHAAGADIYAYRRLIVERGAAGSTAAAHSDTVAVTRWAEPPALHSLCVALAIDEAMQVGAAYARETGSGEASKQRLDTSGLPALWSAAALYMRRGRVWAV